MTRSCFSLHTAPDGSASKYSVIHHGQVPQTVPVPSSGGTDQGFDGSKPHKQRLPDNCWAYLKALICVIPDSIQHIRDISTRFPFRCLDELGVSFVSILGWGYGNTHLSRRKKWAKNGNCAHPPLACSFASPCICNKQAMSLLRRFGTPALRSAEAATAQASNPKMYDGMGKGYLNVAKVSISFIVNLQIDRFQSFPFDP